ncbi:purine-cytosine permease-like protein [Agromyces flavus]|uniref:Purine-cytosine permease n=1 Tax=Agromyces flavus TaxID=589382 RepID=A0A1H1ZVL9_9MICO|nr:cytosine permease [Agromyces flavus]MCP2367299.1 purine-cytosine permease-like protein [Agromyces flavus]GGI46004.1 allantoin permease [Agromyces flavus]SDT37831.1 Purine-cytosine permease [Agromyces flavus]
MTTTHVPDAAAEPRPHGASASARVVPSDRVGHIETHGIETVPHADRHGRPSSLFWVWTSANVVYLYFVLGGGLVLLGLSIWEALAVTVIGNLWWAVVGWLAISGPAAGAPSVTIMRAMFGVRGNTVFGAGLGVAIGLFYEIINIAVATLAANAMLALLGVDLGPAGGWIVLVVIAAVSFVFGVYGHATILALSPYFSAALAIAFVVLAFSVLGAADFSYQAAPLPDGERWAMLLLGYAIIASGPLSWGTGADYARYLPADVSKARVAWWTALGGFLPAVLIGSLGVIAATAIDMTDPQLTIGEIVPAWFTPIFLAIVVLGSVTNNVLVAYSTGFYAQGLGVRISRAGTVVITGILATLAAGWFVYVAPSFLDTLNASLELSVTVLGPLVAIYAVDIALRRNRYDARSLADLRPGAPFWYTRGWFVPGTIAMVAATTVSVLMANTTLYVGPVAAALGGADLSAIVGPVLAGALYAVLWLTTNPYRDRRKRPAAASIAPTAPTAATAPAAPAAIIDTDAAASARTQEEPV